MLFGTCLCGGVSFRIHQAQAAQVLVCQCSYCRQTTGGLSLPFGAFSRSAIEFVEDGTLATNRSSEAATRRFCSGCGAALFMDYDHEKESIWVVLGVIRDFRLVPPLKHESAKIFSESCHPAAAAVQELKEADEDEQWAETRDKKRAGASTDYVAQCFCKGFSARSSTPGRQLLACHCGKCCSGTGTFCVPYVSFPRGGVDFTCLETVQSMLVPHCQEHSGAETRHFCRRCGALCFVDLENEPHVVYLTLGTLQGFTEADARQLPLRGLRVGLDGRHGALDQVEQLADTEEFGPYRSDPCGGEASSWKDVGVCVAQVGARR